jgi:hypothetical protein
LGDVGATNDLIAEFSKAAERSTCVTEPPNSNWARGLGACLGDLAEQVIVTDSVAGWREIARWLPDRRLVKNRGDRATVAFAILWGWRSARPREEWLADLDAVTEESETFDAGKKERLLRRVEIEVRRKTGVQLRMGSEALSRHVVIYGTPF